MVSQFYTGHKNCFKSLGNLTKYSGKHYDAWERNIYSSRVFPTPLYLISNIIKLSDERNKPPQFFSPFKSAFLL